MKINSLAVTTALCTLLAPLPALSANVEFNTAHMQAMDKITGKVSEIDVPVNGEVKFGSFSIVVRSCSATPPEETPENFAFVDVVDVYDEKNPVNIFRGWMMSSSPALNAIEHPIYDVWLLKCQNSDLKNAKILTPEELKLREELPVSKADASKTGPEIKPVAPAAEPPADVVETTSEVPAAQLEKTDSKQGTKDAPVSEADLQAPAENPVVDEAVVLEEGAPKSLLNIGAETPSSQPVDTADNLPEAETATPAEEELTVDEEIPVVPSADELLSQTDTGSEEDSLPSQGEGDEMLIPDANGASADGQLIMLDDAMEDGFEINADALVD